MEKKIVGLGSVGANTAAVLSSVASFEPTVVEAPRKPRGAPQREGESTFEYRVRTSGPPRVHISTGSDEERIPINVSSRFLWVFWVITVISVVSLAFYVYLSFTSPTPTETQKAALEKLSWAFTAGFGALLGLIGGKVA